MYVCYNFIRKSSYLQYVNKLYNWKEFKKAKSENSFKCRESMLSLFSVSVFIFLNVHSSKLRQ